MTKLEILQSYSIADTRNSWFAMGSLIANNNTRIYNKDTIYKVAGAGQLDGSLVFCKEEYIGDDLDWDEVVVYNSQYGEITFGNNIISPNFVLLVTKEELEGDSTPIDTSFVPFKTYYQTTGDVIISDEELKIILSDVGVPFINFDELEYSRETIINLMIKPALQEYFKWFPKTEVVTYKVSTTNTIDYEFPTGAYDVIHVGISQGMATGSPSNILLRYFDEVVWNTSVPTYGHTGGMSSPRTKITDWSTRMLDRAARQGMMNYLTRVHHRVITKNGKKYLSCYTNKQGYLQVHYAMKSLDWGEIEFARLPEARRLATSYVLKNLGMLRSQAKGDIPGTIDYSNWVSRGDEMREKVISEWQEIVRYSGIIRGSM